MSFHVPERARMTAHPVLGSTSAAGNNGAFALDSVEPGWRLAFIVSDGTEDPALDVWEHVSVHAFKEESATRVRTATRAQIIGRPSRPTQSRTPTWREMCQAKDLFWDAEDLVVQFHPRRSEYVNCHPHVLHLWRKPGVAFPSPPAILVGPLGSFAKEAL